MKKIQSVGVYCGSSPDVDGVYTKAAEELGQQLAQHHMTMIYGGGSMGLMGKAADSAMAHGGRVIGFIPHRVEKFEKPNLNITEIHRVKSMHARKRMMYEHSDAFLILPGGFGTLDETFEVITWGQLNLHRKPIIFININTYWDPLRALTENIFDQRFAKLEDKNCFRFVETVLDAMQILLQAPEPSPHKPAANWV